MAIATGFEAIAASFYRLSIRENFDMQRQANRLQKPIDERRDPI